jgi:Uncharacterised nucleotidyltransferase
VSTVTSTDPKENLPAPDSAPETEWSLLRTLLSDTLHQKESNCVPALRNQIRWKVVFDLADRHGVQPLLYQALSPKQDIVPAADMRTLAHLYQTNVHKTLFLSRELIHILGRLQEAGIEVIPYKGVALAEGIYGDMALRQAGDIDLLIRARDLPRIRETLREIGYVPHSPLSAAEERAHLKSGYECVFDSAAGRNLLEVQWAVQPRFYAMDYDQESLFQRAVSIRVAGHDVKTPSADDLFLILSTHAAKHVWERLIWLCDLAKIMQLPQLNWGWIGSQAKELGIERILRVTLLLTNRLLHVAIPAGGESSLSQDIEAVSLAKEIEIHIASGRPFEVESFEYFRLMLRLREQKRDRRRFLTRLVLTPGPGEWAAVRLPEPLFSLYPLVRFGRLAGKLIRT